MGLSAQIPAGCCIRSVKSDEGAIAGPHKTVQRISRIEEVSGDAPVRIDVHRGNHGESNSRVKGGQDAIAGPHEGMPSATGVGGIHSRNYPGGVDAECPRADRARSIECCEGWRLRPHR